MSNQSPSFKSALDGLRQQAHRGVSSAIWDARRALPSPDRKPASRRPQRGAAHALFDGILDAVAETIVDVATSGLELELSALVCETLMQKVSKKIDSRTN